MSQTKRSLFPVLAVMGSLAMVGSATVYAAEQSVESRLLACASETTDTARLACYDNLASVLNVSADATNSSSTDAKTESANVSEPVKPAVDPSTGIPVAASGEPVKRKTETFDTDVKQKQSIRVMVEKTKRNARGDWYFYFDNGEVWKQIDSRGRRIPPLPVAATISRGIFSSHKLHIDGEVWSMKIRRVK